MSLGLIETARVEQGRVPLWSLHMERLTASAGVLGLVVPAALPTAEEVARAAEGIAGVAAVRLTVTAEGVHLEARRVSPTPAGWSACLAPVPRTPGPLHAHKTNQRTDGEGAAAYAAAKRCDEAIWVDGEGRLMEGVITNLFACVGGRVLTPVATGGLLPGIARGRLLAAGRLGGLLVEEGDLRPEDLAAADEAFLTNAVRGAVPLVWWEGGPLRRGALWRAALRAIFGGG